MHDNGGKRGYKVAFLSEDQLPDCRPWVFIEADGVMWLAIKRESVTTDNLEDAWEAFRQAVGLS